jgi:hypothetical protein
MATFQVSHNDDDGYKFGGTWQVDHGFIGFGYGGGSYTIGVRFQSVTIPNAATILTATITGTSEDNSGSNTLRTKVWGIDEDDTGIMTSDPTGRTKTTASADWDVANPGSGGPTFTSPSLVSIVQEIVDRGGWSSGNSMGFIIDDDSSDTSGAVLEFQSHDDIPGDSLYLTVTYSASSESSSISSSASSSESASLSTSNSPSSSESSSASSSLSESSSESSSVSPSSSESASESSSVSASPSSPLDYGIKIAKEGFDYIDGDNNLIFNSVYPLLKIQSSGSGTLTLSSGAGSKTVVTHNLGYLPMFYVWINYADITSGTEIEKLRMCSWSEYAGLGVSSKYDAWATTTTIELDVNTAKAGSETLDYRYVVFYDPLS